MAFLNEAQVAQFHRDGYLVVEDLFDRVTDIEPVINEYHSVLDRLAEELHIAGEISSRYADLPFGQRLIEIYKESGKVHAQYFDFSLPKGNVKPDTPFWAGPAVFRMLRNEKLLDAVESLIGSEIYSNPVQHVRLKPPEALCPKNENGRVQLGKTPVHQDNGVVTSDADDTEMLTVWFPLWDTDVKNGCLCVWPGSHTQGLLDHCPTNLGLQVPGKLLTGKAVSIPMKQGSALFMHRRTLHASHANHSDAVRWSFDLRYNPIGQPTGRDVFPGFVARSRQAPETELHEPQQWYKLWEDTRDRLAIYEPSSFDRWRADSLACA